MTLLDLGKLAAGYFIISLSVLAFEYLFRSIGGNNE